VTEDGVPIPTQRLLFGPVLVALCAVAWGALVAWEFSPYAHRMHQEPLGVPSLACSRPAPLAYAALCVGGWVLMTVAMMLPTTLPLATVFARLTRMRPDRAFLGLLLVVGYLVVWTAFGVAAHALYLALHASIEDNAWLWTNAWVPGALGLALAGAFQFSRLKHRCLDECRSPLAFAAARWGGVAPHRDAFRLGVGHGLYCVGCCWALMLLMFTFALGSLGWMLALAAVMAVEKNLPWGRRLSRPLGIALVLGAVGIALPYIAGMAARAA
jgi:predicted metal-binding membrane protein